MSTCLSDQIRRCAIGVIPMLAWALNSVGDSADGEPVVGAYYYPWYGTYPGGHTFRDTLRDHLRPMQGPTVGSYSSRDSAAIVAHLDQSHAGNIEFWAVSWWGPTTQYATRANHPDLRFR